MAVELRDPSGTHSSDEVNSFGREPSITTNCEASSQRAWNSRDADSASAIETIETLTQTKGDDSYPWSAEWPMNCAIPTMYSPRGWLLHNTVVRYLFAAALVASMFALKLWLTPWTGTGAPFVLFFAAVLVTSLFAGVGPGVFAIALSIPLGVYTFVMGAGYSIAQASFQ